MYNLAGLMGLVNGFAELGSTYGDVRNHPLGVS